MPKGFPELKRRNSSARLRYHRNQLLKAMAQSVSQANAGQVIFKIDLLTGEQKPITRRNFDYEIDWYETFARYRNLSSAASVALDELKRGATLFTKDAAYRMETAAQAEAV